MVAYDPQNAETITVYHKDREPKEIRPVPIGEWCAQTIPVPLAIQEPPSTSRFLDVLEKKHKESQEKLANAISYGAIRKKGKD